MFLWPLMHWMALIICGPSLVLIIDWSLMCLSDVWNRPKCFAQVVILCSLLLNGFLIITKIYCLNHILQWFSTAPIVFTGYINVVKVTMLKSTDNILTELTHWKYSRYPYTSRRYCCSLIDRYRIIYWKKHYQINKSTSASPSKRKKPN